MPQPPRRRQPPLCLRFAPLLALGGSCLLPAGHALADDPGLTFNAGFMRQSPGQPQDSAELALRSLATNQTLVAGRYGVQVLVNLAHAGQHDITFHDAGPGKGLSACLTRSLLTSLGVRDQRVVEGVEDQAQCLDLATHVEGARAEFNTNKLLLSLSIPQASLRRDVAGSVAPERWDAGIDAAFVNYQASAQHSSHRGTGSSSQQSLNLNSGVNLGGWRLRSSQSLREDEQGRRRWTRTNTYAQTDLPGTWGTLTLGETFSNGEVLRSVPFKGLQLASDLGMLPDVMQSYAPVIRGVAQSRAKLEVLQNGYPIYTTYVAAGPYVIDDLGVGGGSGELEIVLTEADGKVQRFLQPYSTLTNLLRNGVWRYTAALGRYNGADALDEPHLAQATLARGMGWSSTLYGGLLASDYYHAGTLGLARDLGALGAVSFDTTHAMSQLGEARGDISGNSFALRYGKAFATRTNLRFAGYRYSTEGYRDLDEVVAERNADSRYRGSRRSRLEASVYQQIGQRNTLSLTLSQDDYWSSASQQRQYQFQFNTQHRGISYNLFASQSLNRYGSGDRLVGLSLSLPLDISLASSASFDVQERAGRYSQRASLNGGALGNRLNYQAALSNDEQQRKSAEVSAGYQTAHASYGAGYTQGSDFNSVSVNASGGVLLHGGGVTLGPYLGETNALIHVPGIADVGIENAPGARTDAGGYAVSSHLRPYRVNQLALRTDQLGPQIEIDNGAMQVVPRRGAIVKATFAARQVTRLVLTLLHPDGRPLPFGSQVSDAQGEVLAVVGQGGQALVAADNSAQSISVRWGKEDSQHCRLHIDPATMSSQQGYRLQSLNCGSSL